MSNSPSQRILEIGNAILKDDKPKQEPVMNLSEFVQVYQHLARESRTNPAAHIVLLGTHAAVQFPVHSSQRIIVEERRRLRQQDFTEKVVNARIYGDKIDYSLSGQLSEEKKNLRVLLPVWLVSLVSMVAMGWGAAPGLEAYLGDPTSQPRVALTLGDMNTVSSLLVTSATLFISIFMVFTVSQNAELIRDDFLFREGLVHKYYRDDVFISVLALVSLSMGILDVVILAVPIAFQIPLSFAGATLLLNKLNIFCPLLISLSVTALTTCFMSIFYYFRRSILVVSTEKARKLLDDLDTPFVEIRKLCQSSAKRGQRSSPMLGQSVGS